MKQQAMVQVDGRTYNTCEWYDRRVREAIVFRCDGLARPPSRLVV